MEHLDDFLTKLDTESDACYKQFHDVKADNAETFDTCNTLMAAAKPPTTNNLRLGQASHQWLLNPKQIGSLPF